MSRIPHLLLAALVAWALAVPAASADGGALSLPTGGLTVTTAGNAALLVAQGLVPGASQASEVTLTNTGAAAGFALNASALLDVAGLDMTVEDVAAGGALYSGPLQQLSSVDLGTLAAGEARRYRVTVAAPPGLLGTVLAALSSLTLTWTAGGPVAGGVGGQGDVVPRTPAQGIASTTVRAPKATLSARAGRHKVTATVSCSTGCRVQLRGTASKGGVSKRLRTVTRTLRHAGHVRIVVKLPSGKPRASVSLRLQATLGTPAVTVRRTVRVLAAR